MINENILTTAMLSKKLSINQLHREQQESNFVTQLIQSFEIFKSTVTSVSFIINKLLSITYYMVRVAILVLLSLLLSSSSSYKK
jgi:hypothetical protein